MPAKDVKAPLTSWRHNAHGTFLDNGIAFRELMKIISELESHFVELHSVFIFALELS